MSKSTRVDKMLAKIISERSLSAGYYRGPTVKKIIDGKTYNTATSTRLTVFDDCERNFGQDFNDRIERLYQTRSGGYFLTVATGGAGIARYEIGGGFQEGILVVPLSDQQAKEWASERDVLDAMPDGDDDTDETEVVISLRLSPAIANKITTLAVSGGVSRNEWIVRCLENCAVVKS
jgi:hypothetical protein